MPTTPLLVFADDWGRHPSSCQHLVRHLLPQHSTVWVNTIGTRTPRPNLETFRRATGKLRQWLGRSVRSSKEPLPPNLTVANPRMWPWLTRRFDRRLNRALLLRQLRPAIESMSQLPVAVTTLPIVADLMGKLPVARWVYYCVDDYGEWPGLDRETMSRLEKEVVAKADVLISVSDNLRARLQRMGRDSHLLAHGVDLDFWRAEGTSAPVLPECDRPLVIFWGVIDRRMDSAFVERLAHSMTRGTILLAGPEQNPDPAVARLPRIHRTGPLPFASLPNLAHEAAVLVMPYVDEPVTRAMQPLKLKEYLATGKPVVVRDLPANRDWADALDLAQTPDAFAATVLKRIESGVPLEQAKARERLANESWGAKAEQFARIIFGS